MDSSCLVLAVQDAGMKPIIVSFTLNDRKSKDFIAARKLAKYFKLNEDLSDKSKVLETPD